MFGSIGITVSVAVLLLNSILPVYADNPYELGRLDYFVTASKDEPIKKYPMNWQEKDAVPQGLVQLLEEPTATNAKAYVEWSKARDKQLKLAASLIDKAEKIEDK